MMRWRRWFAAAMSFLAIVLGSVVITAEPAAAASCSWTSCNGVDPHSSGCDVGAQTLDSRDSHGVKIELRYSSTCSAVWTKYTTNFTSYGRAEVEGCGTGFCLVNFKTIAGYIGEVNWTKMLSWSYTVRSCFFWDGNRECTATH